MQVRIATEQVRIATGSAGARIHVTLSSSITMGWINHELIGTYSSTSFFYCIIWLLEDRMNVMDSFDRKTWGWKVFHDRCR